jgi:hypothetical protein
VTDVDTRPKLHIVLPDPPRNFVTKWMLIWTALAVLTVAVLLWLVLGGSGHHHAPNSAPTHTPVSVTPSKPSAAASSCPSFAHARTGIPKYPPSNVSWSIVDDVALPYSSTSGPAVGAGQIARCFADTPTGSLLALEQVSVLTLVSPDWRTEVASSIVPGPGRDAFVKLRATVTDNSSQPGDYCQAAGFSFLQFTKERSVIEFVGRCGSNLQAGTETLLWDGSDWQIQLQPNGSYSPAVTALADLIGFTPWGAV